MSLWSQLHACAVSWILSMLRPQRYSQALVAATPSEPQSIANWKCTQFLQLALLHCSDSQSGFAAAKPGRSVICRICSSTASNRFLAATRWSCFGRQLRSCACSRQLVQGTLCACDGLRQAPDRVDHQRHASSHVACPYSLCSPGAPGRRMSPPGGFWLKGCGAGVVRVRHRVKAR